MLFAAGPPATSPVPCRACATRRLETARLLLQPEVFDRFLADRKEVARQLTHAYDPVLGRLKLPACETCGQPTNRLAVREERLVGAACA